jgi:hypothetical protein
VQQYQLLICFGEEQKFYNAWRSSVNVSIRAGLLGLFESPPPGSRWPFGHTTLSDIGPYPLYPQKQTLAERVGMFA